MKVRYVPDSWHDGITRGSPAPECELGVQCSPSSPPTTRPGGSARSSLRSRPKDCPSWWSMTAPPTRPEPRPPPPARAWCGSNRTGAKAARSRRASARPCPRASFWTAFLTLDGDGQHDPDEIPRLLEAWERSGADLVVGMRDYGRHASHPLVHQQRQPPALLLGPGATDSRQPVRLQGAQPAPGRSGSCERGAGLRLRGGGDSHLRGSGLRPRLGAHQDHLRDRKERHQALDALLELHPRHAAAPAVA